MVKFCHILSTIHNISYPAFCSILSQKSVILLPDTGILTLPPPPTPFDPPNTGQAYLLYIKKEHPVRGGPIKQYISFRKTA